MFYTDSNGLEMQRRQLNYRPTWNLTVYEGGVNVTANYFPINSAIAMVDESTNMQFTVMNDRSQGGSVYENGRIELMQNRRGNVDDGRGVGEALDETTSTGVGITVPATYYVQYFNRLTQKSLQRQVQQISDDPVQQFYAFNVPNSDLAVESTYNGAAYSDLLASTGFTAEMKLELFAMDQNKILMRVENLADIFDSNGAVQNTTIQLKNLCDGLYTMVNGATAAYTMSIEEMSMTANQSYQAMIDRKIQWTTVDGQQKMRAPSTNVDVIELQQQRIRVF